MSGLSRRRIGKGRVLADSRGTGCLGMEVNRFRYEGFRDIICGKE